jgi:soluble lytic murein transglycosylase
VLSGRFKSWWVQRQEWNAAEYFATQPGMAPKAFDYFRKALEDPAWRARRCDAAEFLAKSYDSNDLWLSADTLIRYGAVKSAAPVVLALSPMATGSVDTLARWRYLQGRVLLGDGKTVEDGRALLQQVADEQKGSPWAAKSLYQLVKNYGSNARATESDALLARLLAEYPASEEAGDAIWWRAGWFLDKGDAASAIAEYRRLAAQVPSHEKAADALLAAGNILKTANKPKDALSVFQGVVSQYPASKSRFEAAYWSGRLYEESVDKKSAVQSYRVALEGGLGDYYAGCALARLHKLDAASAGSVKIFTVPGAGMAMGLMKTPASASAPSGPTCGDDEVARLRFFGANGLPEGEWESLYLAERQASEPTCPSLLTAMADAGYAHTAGQVADALGWDPEKGDSAGVRLRIMYPKAYWDDVSLVARQAGLDPFLLLSVARQESTFRASIASGAGATGVMQLMPATAAWLAEKEPGVAPEDATSLECPSSSLRMGAFYLARMVASNDGNVAAALAAYNAGPGNVRKWRRAQPGADTETFIESIPFSETQTYVKRVLGNLAAYRSIYDGAGK